MGNPADHGNTKEVGNLATDGDGWEDFDDKLYSKGVDFNQLKEFMTPNGELKRARGYDNSVFEILMEFFKVETSNGSKEFKAIFDNGLNDGERKLLLEYLAFT